MATATKTDAPFAAQTRKALAILVKIGESVKDITGKTKELAAVVVEVRGSIERSVTSKKTNKAVVVKDWDGRSPEYRDWYRDTFLPLVEEHIPSEFRGTIRTRVQNATQELVHKTAPAAQKAHLGLKVKSKATTQTDKRAKAAEAATAAERPVEDKSTTDGALTDETLKAMSPVDIAALTARCSTALLNKVRRNVKDMTKADKERCFAFNKQSMSDLMSTNSTLDKALTGSKAVAESNKSGVKVEA